MKSKQTKDSILKSALTLFKKKGFERTSMRDIAAQAGVALGATYYYFRTKEDLVFDFYQRLQTESEESSREVLKKTNSFEERFRALTIIKFEQLKPYRKFLNVLSSNALDIGNPVSPFGKETSDVRDRAIALWAEAIEGSDLVAPPELKEKLPQVVWLAQMGVLYFWINDSSKDQQKTKELLDLSLSLLVPLLGLTALPMMSEANQKLVALLGLFESGKKNA